MSHNHRKGMSRRRFIGEASCAAIGSTTFLSTALNLGMINTAAARPHIIGAQGDYKALVVILLAGGADSHNMLIPTSEGEYDSYRSIRGDLALNYNQSGMADDVMNISSGKGDGKTYGVHNGLSDIHGLYTAVNPSAAFVANVGTLVEPIVDVTDLHYGSKRLPLGLYSHADQIMQWQTSVPEDRSAVGVGGRIADMLKDMNTIDTISMNISLDGKNRFQSGNTIAEYSIGNSNNPNDIGIEGLIPWWSNSGYLTEQRDKAINNYVSEVYNNIFQDTYASLARQTIDGGELFKSAIAKRPGFSTPFADTSLSQDLRMMADVMSVNQHLGACRQIFFTTFGGWDHHDEVLMNQQRMLPMLNDGIFSLYNALGEPGVDLQDKVTIMTISDFGRTMTTNTGGSDHAWGGNSMIVGGAVNGGQIFGNYPELRLNDNPLNIDDRGRYIPQTSVDELYAELALWFGVSVNDLSYILPNIGNFNDYNSNPAPLGIFS